MKLKFLYIDSIEFYGILSGGHIVGTPCKTFDQGYGMETMQEEELDPDPLRQFNKWFEEAVACGETLPEAMALATASPEGVPSVRMVLFKGIHQGGIEFFTNLNSRKGREMELNPNVAAVFWWRILKCQLRLEGRVEKLQHERSAEYFEMRSRGSQIGAWASEQSHVLLNREELENRVKMYERKYRGRKVPCPPFWGGFRLIPSSIEFWKERADRLHDRFRYRRSEGKGWILERLAP